jgi:hypothetical protein
LTKTRLLVEITLSSEKPADAEAAS